MLMAMAVSVACIVVLAQSTGEAVYKARCLNCHGAIGLADSGIGKIMKVKPVTDPSIRNMSLPGMIRATENGMGKMQGYKNDLTDAQIREVVVYFRTLIK